MKLETVYLFIKTSKSKIRSKRKAFRPKIGRAKLPYLNLDLESKESNKRKQKEKQLRRRGRDLGQIPPLWKLKRRRDAKTRERREGGREKEREAYCSILATFFSQLCSPIKQQVDQENQIVTDSNQSWYSKTVVDSLTGKKVEKPLKLKLVISHKRW